MDLVTTKERDYVAVHGAVEAVAALERQSPRVPPRVQASQSWIIAAATAAATILASGLCYPTAAPNNRTVNKNGTCGGLARARGSGKLAMLMINMPAIGTSDGPNVLTSRHTLQHCLATIFPCEDFTHLATTVCNNA